MQWSNLADSIRHHAEATPDGLALVECAPSGERRTLSWTGFDQAVNESAAAYAGLGLVAGQRVVIVTTNTIESVVAYYGALRCGLIAVPVNQGMPGAEMRRIVEDCGARCVLTDEEWDDLPGAVQTPLATHRAAPAEAPASPRDPESLAVLIYTAGSSGTPKGVMLTHRALLAYCRSAERIGLPGEQAVVICVLPLFHVYGLNAVLGGAVHAGATTVLVEGLPANVCRLIVQEKVTHLPLTPSALYRITEDPDLLEAAAVLHFINSGAAPLPNALAEYVTRLTGHRVDQGFGLTEAAPGVATTFGYPILGPGHVGRAFPGVELRVGDGHDPVEPAEIWIKGENLFSGYWPDGEGGPDSDGWFATGDVGYLQGEDLFLVDRSRELIIVSGFNVYPREIEDILEGHPSIQTAAVIGQPDEHTGERVVAFLTGEKISVAEVMDYLASRLARYKIPSEILVLKAMPRATTGKIRKGVLRDLLDRTEEGEW